MKWFETIENNRMKRWDKDRRKEFRHFKTILKDSDNERPCDTIKGRFERPEPQTRTIWSSFERFKSSFKRWKQFERLDQSATYTGEFEAIFDDTG